MRGVLESPLGAPGDRRIRWRASLALAALLPLGFLLQKLAAERPGATERWYARGLYPRVHGLVAGLAERSPVSLGEASLLACVLVVVWRTWRGLARWRAAERSLANLVGHALAQVLGGAGLVYACFLVLWGLNYARLPYAASVGLDVRPASAEELIEAVERLVAQAGERRAACAEDQHGVLSLRGGKAAVLERLPAAFARVARDTPVLAGRPPVVRVALASPLLSAFGIAGIYWPFTGEAHVNGEVPDASFPFHAAHEVAHQRGFAREDEANYVAYRACTLSGDPELAYAGTLAALQHVLRALGERDAPRALELRLGAAPGVLRDLAAISAFWTPSTPALQITRTMGASTNHAYLQVQGEEEGARSYGRMVDLLIAEQRRSRP